MISQQKAYMSDAGISTSYSGDFPASPIALQDAVRGLVTSVISGRSYVESFAKLAPDGSWAKMSGGFFQMNLDGFSEEYCETWPAWGTLSAGVCGVPVTWARRTSGKGSSSWPTVRASDGSHGGPNSRGRKGDLNLPGAVSHPWPTPTARDFKPPDMNPESKRYMQNTELNSAVYWATLNAADGIGSYGRGQGRSLRSDTHGMGGVLNPDWVELLMGFPPGWTFLGGPQDGDKRSTHTNRRE